MNNITAFITANGTLSFAIFAVLGAVCHWAKLAYRKETSWNPLDYFLADAPGHSAGMVGVMATAILAADQSSIIAGLTPGAMFMMAWMLGWTVDSGVNITGKQATAASVAKDATKQNGFVLLRMLGILLLLSIAFGFVQGCSGTPVAQTKNEAQALTYYSIGEAYDGLDAAFKRGDITAVTAKKLELQVDLALALLDLSRKPDSTTAQASLKATSDSLNALGVLSASQEAQVASALQLASTIGTGQLPAASDTSGWLLLGANVLRTVSAAIPAKK